MSPSTRRNGVRSAEIGREGETGVVRALHRHGFSGAERRRVRLHDALDIVAGPGVIVSVKAGGYAKDASLVDVDRWAAEAEAKRLRERADIALLVVQRRGYGPARAEDWRAWILGLDAWGLRWESRLRWALDDVRRAGYGDPIETAS